MCHERGRDIADIERVETGPIHLFENAEVGDEPTYVLVPVLDVVGQFWSVFADGSYAAWKPRDGLPATP